jgi:methylenetetrahydrofolate reductase (NADPH)
MEKTNGKRKVLVIGSESDLPDITTQALDPEFEIIYASNDEEALDKARKEIPDAIILGYLDPRGSAFDLHQKLRGGWITKNIPLLVVDIDSDQRQKKGWRRDEGLQMDADNYVAISGRYTGEDSTAIAQMAKPLKDKLSSRLEESVNTLREAIEEPNTFCVTWEQIAGRGAFEIQQEEIIDNVAKAIKGGIVHGVSVTDNPGGNPAISTEMLCAEIKKLGIEPLVHLACRDKNRNEMESVLYGLAAAGVKNLLMLTGDAPSNAGFSGQSKPVFDLDPVHAVQLIDEMNSGLEHEVMRKKKTLAPTDLFAGVCISPFKKQESELRGQYYKLGKKIRSGAKFVITQVGYDARKYDELLRWLRLKEYDTPVLANIYVLPYGTAKLMNANQIPGCVVTDKLVAELAEEAKAPDKGKTARLLKAAKLYALTKGLGYTGAHIGGHGITYEMVEYIVSKGEELAETWQELVAEFDYPQKDGFYFFDKNPETGLNLDKPAARTLKPKSPFIYKLARVAHALLFNPDNRLFNVLRPVAKFFDAKPARKKTFGYFEHMAKVALFDCMNCGDCALFEVGYLCPMSQCPKSQRNGPCGGSYNGWCEVYPNERKCVWVKAYERLKADGEEDEIGSTIVPPCNWELWETPSWLNFYLGRDHVAKRLGIEPPEKKQKAAKAS